MSPRVCVVGAGQWGKNHVRVLSEMGCLGGVVDTSEVVRREIAGHCPGVFVSSDLSAALESGFDGFVVATPAETHHAVAKTIIEAGRPVLVEKPLALNTAHARELRDLAARRAVNLMVGHVLLFHPAIVAIKRLIDEGALGNLQYLYSHRLNLGTVRTEENILWSFAPHDISIFQFLVRRQPTEVVSRGGAFLQPHVHDSTMTVLGYPDNIVGHVFVSWLHPFKEHRLVVIGSSGMVSFEDSGDKELLFYEKGDHAREGQRVAFEPSMPLTEELRYFVEHLDGTPVEIATAESGIEVLEILERATQSLMSGAAEGHDVHPSSYVDHGVRIGAGTKIWHFCHVQENAVIGKGCTLGQNVNVARGVQIGDHVKIQNNVSIYEGVELEDHVFCGPSMVFTNVTHPRSKYPQKERVRTLVKEGASIGANATVVCGHTIGRHAMIAAGAVVTTDVPDHALMVGVPAVQNGWICECGEPLELDCDATKCRRCQRGYRLEEGRLVLHVSR